MRALHHRHTLEEYLALEAEPGRKHEFVDGQIYVMSGGTPEHARLIANVTGQLFATLEDRPCEVFTAELRVHASEDSWVYPDVVVVCGEIQVDPKDKNTITNPIVVVEVLSSSTEEYDRDAKFDYYKQLASLREYVLVSSTERRVEIRRRMQNLNDTDVARVGKIALASIECTLDLERLYRSALKGE